MTRPRGHVCLLLGVVLAAEPACTDGADAGTETDVATTTSDSETVASTTESSTSEPSTGATEPSSTTSPTVTTEPTSATETGSSTETDEPTTTGPMGCTENAECTNAAAPFCEDEVCVSCESTPAPDVSCTSLDEGTPVCVDGSCRQCDAGDTSACVGTTPLCDTETNTCVGCRYHEECQDLDMDLPACNIAAGSCFGTANVSMVNAGLGGSIQSAVNAVPAGTEHAIVLTGDGANHTVVIDGGKTIAIVSNNTTVRSVRGNDGAAVLTVSGAGTTVYLHRLRVEDTDDWGIRVSSGGVLYADGTQVAQNTGGGIELQSGTEGYLRNCMVGGNEADVDAIAVNSASIDILYTALLGGAFDSHALACTSPGNVDIRNSILTTRGANAAMTCTGANVSNTSTENVANIAWFDAYATGDAHLTASGGTQFANVAIWETGDPPFDSDGDLRPTTDAAADYAGADIP